MSQHPSEVPMSPQSSKPQKGWFGRNWWWVLLLAIGLPLLCCGGFIGLGAWGINKGMAELEKLPPYANSVQMVENDPRSIAALGTPIEVAGLFEGATTGRKFEVSDVNFTASLPVSGPQGSGMLVIDAELDTSGNWVYDTQQLELDDGTVIDFIAPQSLIDSALESIGE